MSSLTQAEALQLFEYKDGTLFWKEKPRCSRKPNGSFQAGTFTHGYVRITVNKKKYYSHQLVFLMFNGYIPKLIDHIDGDGTNNKIENLRESDKSKNAMNSKLRKNSTSGHRGVMKSKKPNSWSARVQVNKKIIYLGTFDDFELACLVADEARVLYYGEHARI